MDAILCIGVAYENLCANRCAAAAAAKTVYALPSRTEYDTWVTRVVVVTGGGASTGTHYDAALGDVTVSE